MNRAEWTKVSLDQLDEIKSQLKSSLKALGEKNGNKYRIRVFYIGPRKITKFSGMPRQTSRKDATAAKIGIYKFYKGKFGSGNFELEAYL